MATRTHQGSHRHVLDELGHRITSGDIAEGTVLTLAGLEAEFGASRTVIREAVRVLEDHGLVTSRRRIGVTVQRRENWDCLNASVIRWTLDGPRRMEQMTELMELRSAVEPVAAALAAARATDEQRAEITRLMDELGRLGDEGRGDSEEYLAADIAFHEMLLLGSGNALLAQLATPVSEILTARTALGFTPADPHPEAMRGHRKAAAAIAAGDVGAAEAGARVYISTVSGEVAHLRSEA